MVSGALRADAILLTTVQDEIGRAERQPSCIGRHQRILRPLICILAEDGPTPGSYVSHMLRGAGLTGCFVGHAAMLINEGLPNCIVSQLRSLGLQDKTVAILGMAFKGDSDDKRESLSYKLRNLLALESKEVLCRDPYITDSDLIPPEDVIERADFESVTVESQGGALNLELTVKSFLAGCRMIEVLFSWRDRTSGQSQFRL